MDRMAVQAGSLCTAASRAFHKLLEIQFPKSFQQFLNKWLFVTNVAQKLLEKTKINSWSALLKYAICTSKVRFVKILCTFGA